MFAAAAVLIIGWQAGSAANAHSASASGLTTTPTPKTKATTTPSTGSSTSTGAGTPSDATSSTSSTSSTSPASSTGGLKDGAYTGAAEQTRYGVLQVKVTVSGGTITDVSMAQEQAVDGHSQMINSRAIPILKQEVLAAQSATVNYVSGATYTSDGYLASLQSALDQAS